MEKRTKDLVSMTYEDMVALCNLLYMLHHIREIAHFMNWPYYSCPFHELGDSLFIFCPIRELGKNMKRPAT
jgi:hypothetical protein